MCWEGAMRPYLKAWPGVSTDSSVWGIVHSLSESMLKNSHSPTLVTPNSPPLLAWSPLTALPCRLDHPQLPSLAGLMPPNCPPLLAILCQHRGRIFDHMGAAILCVGVMVNLHITLLLDRIEARCMGGGQLVCLEGVPDQGEGFLGAWGSLGEWPVVVCRLATPPGNPSRGYGVWDLFIFYN
uniref:Uncharacterized protein n=1 Tax=Pipistrellus kuhlii TaxID=59472 RepID=A0A7J7VBT5_PIPKU|nr:hypothetical protein mPipKuh1_008481 [Pipistrellus kuhlii]